MNELFNKASIARPFKRLGQTISAIIPRHCLFCLEKTQSHFDICHHCYNSLAINAPCCQRCASPVAAAIHSDITLCGNCLSHDYQYDRVHSPYLYCEEIRYLIRKLKYQNKIHYAEVLADLFTNKAAGITNFQLPQVIIPMPMHPRRLRQRGFNQAMELGRAIANRYQLPLNYTSLIRHRHTDIQAGLAASERQKNVRHAFKLIKPVNYDHVVLIDDVMTTGSTVNEAAKVLKKHGIPQVDVWTIARAGLKN